MRRVAIIQNESEMMRYGWADVRPSVERYGYYLDNYTSENLSELFPRLAAGFYDALLIATNACSNLSILKMLRERANAELKTFLCAGKGFLVSHQDKLADAESYGIFPDGYDIRGRNRRRENNETSTQGHLTIVKGSSNNPVCSYPNRLLASRIADQALHNKMVEGLYVNYLVPISSGVYEPLFEDDDYTPARQLLLVTRPDLPPRIVVSGLLVDCQGHDELWENVLRYVVEGRPSIAIISKQGSSLLDFQYLAATLEIRKIPCARYDRRQLNIDDIPLEAHDALLLDPNWNEHEVLALIDKYPRSSAPALNRLFFFRHSLKGEPILSIVSRRKDFERVSRNALTWLISMFPGIENRGYWAGSFWTTVDVLDTLVTFGRPIEEYRTAIFAEIDRHDKDGSYDEVVGTSCGLLQVYKWFLGTDDERYRRTLKWIRERMISKTLYEQATALEVLANLGEDIPQEMRQTFRSEVHVNLGSLNNEFALFRYITSLTACGYAKDAEELALKLEPLQDRCDGRWVNIPNTAATVQALLRLQDSVDQPSAIVEAMVFRGVQFIKQTYLDRCHNWDNNSLATAKCLKALKTFEQRISLPIDELLPSLEQCAAESRSFIAIDRATEMNVSLQKEVVNLRAACTQLEEGSRLSRRLNAVLLLITAPVIAVYLLYIRHLASHHLIWSSLPEFSSEVVQTSLAVLSFLVFIVLLFLLERLDLLPAWVEKLVSPILKWHWSR